MTRALLLAALLCCAASPAAAGVFKCKGPGGEVIYSNEPCAEVGAKTERKLRRDELRSNSVRMPSEPVKRERPPSAVVRKPDSHGTHGPSVDPDLKIYEGASNDPRPGMPRSVVLEHGRKQR
jgi:hypothetical protein